MALDLDLDDALRRVDDLCDAGAWKELLDLRDRCRTAYVERGRQLWPAASHAEYRLALQAPGRWAAAVVVPGSGHFALGPLSEVAASSHDWADLAPHLPPTPEAALVAQERVLRGEDLRGDSSIDRSVVELPLVLQDWEPAYPQAVYKPYTAEFEDAPAPLAWATEAVPAPGKAIDDHGAVPALQDLVGAWTTQSNGRASGVAVVGDALAAVGALGVAGNIRLAPLATDEAVALMAWAAASGGAHGRRRGMAQGRFAAWWALAAVAGTLDDWPQIDDALDAVRWYRWDHLEPSTGWSLRLAAERPADGRAWALDASDSRAPT